MANIIVNTLGELDPGMMEVARPLVAKWEAAVLRVAAAHADPNLLAFTPAAGTTEAILTKRFQHLSAAKQKAAGVKAAATLKSPRALKRLGLVGHDLTEARSIDEIVGTTRGVTGQPHATAAAATTRRHDHRVATGAAVTPGALTSLRLELVRMVCVDETDAWFGVESGQDEIMLGGVGLSNLDGTGEVGKIGPHDLGGFDDWGSARQKDYSPAKTLFTFDLTTATSFPASYFATLVLVEVDQGDFSDTMNEIIEKLKGEAIDKLTAIAGSTIGLSGGPLGAAVGALVGYAVGKVFNALVRAWGDDPFEPQTIEVIIPSADATFDGHLTQKSAVVHFGGPGKYAMRYQWAVSKVGARVVAVG